MLILMAGLPGTGKSTLAKALADQLSGSVLSKDTIRHAIFEPRDIEYSKEQDDFCMGIMLQTAASILSHHPERYIFLDGRTFSRRYEIDQVAQAAQALNQPWRILECTCSEATASARLEKQSDHPAGNRDFKLYLEVKRRFEPITRPKIVVNSDVPLEECVTLALRALQT